MNELHLLTSVVRPGLKGHYFSEIALNCAESPFWERRRGREEETGVSLTVRTRQDSELVALLVLLQADDADVRVVTWIRRTHIHFLITAIQLIYKAIFIHGTLNRFIFFIYLFTVVT